jgi:hypothetical protein
MKEKTKKRKMKEKGNTQIGYDFGELVATETPEVCLLPAAVTSQTFNKLLYECMFYGDTLAAAEH